MNLFKSSLLFILLTGLAYGQGQPRFLVTESSIVEEFRGQLRSKLSELSQNYIVNQNETVISWSSPKSLECMGFSIRAKAPLASVVRTQIGETHHFETRDCLGKTLFAETFTLEDKTLSLKDYLSGSFPIDGLSRYTFTDLNRKKIFELHKQATQSDMIFLDHDFLTIMKEAKRWQYLARGFTAHYSQGGYSLNIGMEFPDTRLTIDWSRGPVRILDSDNALIPINTFLTGYSHMVQGTTLMFVSGIVKNSMRGLPTTEFVSAGGQNSRFLDEMRLAYTRLLNNLEINLVRQFVQDVIAALESGLLKITDNRPAVN